MGAGGAQLEAGPSERLRLAARLVIAIACASAVSAVAWSRVGDHLSLRTDIVGSTIFDDFDVYHLLDHFYILILLLPGLAAVLYLVMARWGPVSSQGSRPTWPPPLVVTDAAGRSSLQVPGPRPGRPDSGTPRQVSTERQPSPGRSIGVAARLALPAFVIAAEIEIGSSPRAESLNVPLGIAAVLAYVAVVAVAALILNRRYHQGRNAWAAANALLTVAALPMLLLVSASTTVSIASDNRVVHYPWLPLWVAVSATLIALALVTVGLIRSAWRAAPRVERWVLLGVAGPVAVFLCTAVLQGAQGFFIGYDDAMSMTGARLLFGHGLWPWRDVFLLHGFLDDALYGQIGMWIFGATAWGSNAGQLFFVAPLTVISLYGFVVYFARRNRALIIAGCLAAVLGLLATWPGTRFILIPPLLVLLDRVLRRATWGRCWLFMTVAIIAAIVTPESILPVFGILATVALAELTHHRWGAPLWEGFRRTLRCAVAGVTLTVAWIAFLLATSSLSGFVSFYLAVTAGHELWGALPVALPFDTAAGNLEFFVPLALFLLTVVKVVHKLQSRAPWRSVEWVLVASATFVPLYYQEALERMDLGHVDVLFQAMVPLILLWAFELVSKADAWFDRAVLWNRTRESRAPRPRGSHWATGRSSWPWPSMSLAAVVAGICVVAVAPQSLGSWVDLPGNFHASVPVAPAAGIPLGYTLPGAVDTTQLEDLETVLNRYAGPAAPVFDFTNEPGVTYFLLNRVPAAPFYHVGAAQTLPAQQLEVAALKRSRPPVVIFNDITFGLADYDEIWSMERDFLISQYILDNYQPILDVEGQIVMLRDDLMSAKPSPPALLVPPVTTGLYFADEPACDWRDAPDFLDPPTQSEAGSGQPVSLTPAGHAVTARGWAFDSRSDRPAAAVLAVAGGVVIGETTPTGSRPDVAAALHTSEATMTGWALGVSADQSPEPTFYALNGDGTVTPIPSVEGSPAASTIRTPQGTVYRVVASPNAGNVDEEQTETVITMSLTGSASLSSYQWLEFDSPSGFGQASIEVTDQTLGAEPSHVISFQTLPQVGQTVFLRVGSCIQWHGFQADHLDLVVQGAPSDMAVRVLP